MKNSDNSEYIEVLSKQLQLLSELSREPNLLTGEVTALTAQMVNVVNAIILAESNR